MISGSVYTGIVGMRSGKVGWVGGKAGASLAGVAVRLRMEEVAKDVTSMVSG